MKWTCTSCATFMGAFVLLLVMARQVRPDGESALPAVDSDPLAELRRRPGAGWLTEFSVRLLEARPATEIGSTAVLLAERALNPQAVERTLASIPELRGPGSLYDIVGREVSTFERDRVAEAPDANIHLVSIVVHARRVAPGMVDQDPVPLRFQVPKPKDVSSHPSDTPNHGNQVVELSTDHERPIGVVVFSEMRDGAESHFEATFWLNYFLYNKRQGTMVTKEVPVTFVDLVSGWVPKEIRE